jgi:hypothetical protein
MARLSHAEAAQIGYYRKPQASPTGALNLDKTPQDDIFARQAQRSERNVKIFAVLAILFFLVTLWLMLRDDL